MVWKRVIRWPNFSSRAPWCTRFYEPKIKAVRYSLLIAAWALDGPAPWREITAQVPVHYTYANRNLRWLQGRGYVMKVGVDDGGKKLYQITGEGEEVLLKKKLLREAVENGWMGRWHAQIMLSEAEYWLGRGFHLRLDLHYPHKEEHWADIVATPICGLMYDLGHQIAIEIEVNPSGHGKRTRENFKGNVSRGWPSVWVPLLNRHQPTLVRILKEEGARLVEREEDFKEPRDVVVMPGIWYIETPEEFEEKRRTARRVIDARLDDKKVYVQERTPASERAPGSKHAYSYGGRAKKQEHLGRLDRYGERIARDEVKPEDAEWVLDHEERGSKIAGQLADAVEGGELPRISGGRIWVGARDICGENELIWSEDDEEWIKVEEFLLRLLR